MALGMGGRLYILLGFVCAMLSACTGGGGGGGDEDGGGPGQLCSSRNPGGSLVQPRQLVVPVGETRTHLFRPTGGGRFRITSVRANSGSALLGGFDGPVSVTYTPPTFLSPSSIPPSGSFLDEGTGLERSQDVLTFELFDSQKNCTRVARVPVRLLRPGESPTLAHLPVEQPTSEMPIDPLPTTRPRPFRGGH